MVIGGFMKITFITLSLIFGALVSRAADLPKSIDCKVSQFDTGEKADRLKPVQLSDIHVDQEQWSAAKTSEFPVGEYEGTKVALSFDSFQLDGDKIVSMALVQQFSETSYMSLSSALFEGKTINLSYREPGSTKFLVIMCEKN